MAYASWSVVFGEQPSAAKWNILGTNDAEFNSLIQRNGTGLLLLDSSGNEIMKGTTVASATNEWTAGAVATAGRSTLIASGSDTNVSGDITGQGTGSVYVETGSDADIVATSQTTASTSYADLATTGPAVSVYVGVGGRALVSLYAFESNSGANGTYMSFAISGATTVAAADNMAIVAVGTSGVRHGASFLVEGLTPGTNTFTSKYKADAGTATFVDRRIGVIPL